MDNQGVNKIALFVPSLRGGGAEKVMLTLASYFAETGYSVDLLLAAAEGAYVEDIPAKVRVVDLKGTRVITSLVPLAKYLRRERPDVTLSAMAHANIVALFAKYLARVKTYLVFSEHSMVGVLAGHSRILKSKLIPTFIRLFYNYADAVVAVSFGVKDELVNLLGVSEKKMIVLYNPVVTERLFKLAQEEVVHPWFNDDNVPVVIGVGRLSREKDYETMIRAFAKLAAIRPTRLVIIGEGEQRPVLEALVNKLGLKDKVSLPGFAFNPYGHMSRAALLVLSSVAEGLSNVLIEAMACGCPVVSTDCPSGPAEILEGGKYGPLVPVGDVNALAEAMENVLDNPMDQEMLKARAMDFHVERIGKQYLEVFLDLQKKDNNKQ